jgi:flagellar operon protein
MTKEVNMNIDAIHKLDAIAPAKPVKQDTVDKPIAAGFEQTFKAALAGKTDLKFSNHALGRLAVRGVPMDEQTVSRLNKAVSIADQKGSNQSLVLLDEMAFLISVKNKTIITAMDTNSMKEGVVTKIDSTVII